MSQPRRSARLAAQRDRAELVSIPLDDDTNSLVSISAVCVVCGESGSHLIHLPCCDVAVHQGCVEAGCPFFSSGAAALDPVQVCVECRVQIEDEPPVFSCCSSAWHLRCLAPRVFAVDEEVFCPNCPLETCDNVSVDRFHRLCLINGVEWSSQPEMADCVVCTGATTMENLPFLQPVSCRVRQIFVVHGFFSVPWGHGRS